MFIILPLAINRSMEIHEVVSVQQLDSKHFIIIQDFEAQLYDLKHFIIIRPHTIILPLDVMLCTVRQPEVIIPQLVLLHFVLI